MLRIAKALALAPGADPARFHASDAALEMRQTTGGARTFAIDALMRNREGDKYNDGSDQPPRRNQFGAERQTREHERGESGPQSRVAELAITILAASVQRAPAIEMRAVFGDWWLGSGWDAQTCILDVPCMLPRLRGNLDFMPSPVEDRPGLMIRDPFHYSDATLIVPPALTGALEFYDGEHSALDLRAYLVRLSGDLKRARSNSI
jgi:hypothetical protein